MKSMVPLFDRYVGLFRAHPPDSVLEGVGSRYATLDLATAPEELRAAVLDLVELPGSPDAMVLARFGPGDYALPERAGETLGGADWCVYLAFGGSTVNGLTFWNGEEFLRALDADDRPVTLAPDAWCWTSPVRGGVRYAVMIGGRDD